MKYMKFNFLFIFLLNAFVSYAHSLISDASPKTSGLIGNGANLPYWMVHNQLGKYSSQGNWQQLTEGNFSGGTRLAKNLKLSYGTNLALLVSEKGINPEIIEAYMGLSGKVIHLQAGAFADDEVMGGLSSTNGDLLRSLNYRPYPKVRLSTSGFIPFFVAKRWLRLSAEYDEGLLTDQRIVDKPHLHHKSLMFQFRTSSTMRFILGINHYVFWGGKSDQYGQLPDHLNNYISYVTGRPGSADFPVTDQLNVAGNQLGSYLLTIEKEFENFHLEIRANHPFEDGSGMGFENLKDNLYTFHFRKNKAYNLLNEWVFEYLYSKHQSGNPPLQAGQKAEHYRGMDNYFNHSIYQTGFTYLGRSMGTPLFEPIRFNQEGIVSGLANNRVSAFHLGAKGYLIRALQWKALVTYSRNFGTYAQPYDPFRRQLYSLGELIWTSKNHPFLLSALMAVDVGDLTTNQLGMGLQVQWTLK